MYCTDSAAVCNAEKAETGTSLGTGYLPLGSGFQMVSLNY